METLDSAHMRILNSSTLLKMIWRDKEISRADISQRTGMSRSTVSTIVADLIRRGLVTETGTGHSNGGRRPVILAFNEDAYSILGIDLGLHHIRATITNLRAGVRHWWQEECSVQDRPDVCIDHIFDLVHRAKIQANEDGKPLIGIGIAVPGPVHPDHESNPMDEVLHPNWSGIHLQKILKEKIKLPLTFENDAKLGALAEHWWREPVGQGNLAYICARTGLEAGLIIDGRVHRGSHGRAGNIALMPLAKDRDQLLDLGQCLQEALKLEQTSEEANDTVSRYLVHLTRNLLSLLDLDAIVFDESLLKKNSQRLQEIRSLIEQVPLVGSQGTRLDGSSRGEKQIAVGASTLILAQALDDFSLFPPATGLNVQWAWSRENTLST